MIYNFKNTIANDFRDTIANIIEGLTSGNVTDKAIVFKIMVQGTILIPEDIANKLEANKTRKYRQALGISRIIVEQNSLIINAREFVQFLFYRPSNYNLVLAKMGGYDSQNLRTAGTWFKTSYNRSICYSGLSLLGDISDDVSKVVYDVYNRILKTMKLDENKYASSVKLNMSVMKAVTITLNSENCDFGLTKEFDLVENRLDKNNLEYVLKNSVGLKRRLKLIFEP